MSKHKAPASLAVDPRYSHLEELKRRMERERDTGRWYYPEKYPDIAKLEKDYRELHAEVYPSNFFDRVIQDAEDDTRLMGRIESLLADREDLRGLFKGEDQEARAIELEKNQELRGKILSELEKTEEIE